MDTVSIDLNGSQIAAIDLEGRQLKVRFSRAYLVKTMTGSNERTRWWQAGDLVIDEAEALSPIPTGPLVCVGGDVDENIYTYRNMIPVPLSSRGHARILLHFEGVADPLVVTGSGARLEMRDVPKYIEHIRPQADGTSRAS
ncbi:MAG: hypothetical protein EOM91_04735 [Sphingobacteriia bacterium]|nr:hypothetical protein [Sphingobacteriia bacterium]NCC38686.1 hypothetical protein [Gammaproteobacteria bacterium]